MKKNGKVDHRLRVGDQPVTVEVERDADGEEATVELIASGYEWTCPNCDHFHVIVEVTETVKCNGCHKVYKTDSPEHAYE